MVLMSIKTFTVTEQHCKLYARLHFYVSDTDYGDWIVTNAKRPFGNSNVYGDMAEILEIEQPDWESGEQWSDEQERVFDELYIDLATVCEIASRVGYCYPGEYEAESYSTRWRAVDGVPRVPIPVDVLASVMEACLVAADELEANGDSMCERIRGFFSEVQA